VVSGLAAGVAVGLAADAAYLAYVGRPWALVRWYSAERNPAWGAARYRAVEHADNPLFNQWYYNMVSDAATGAMVSFGFGGFKADGIAGGWLKVKGLPGVADYATHAWPEEWHPFDHMAADGSLNVRIYRRPPTSLPAAAADGSAADSATSALGAARANATRYALAAVAADDVLFEMRVLDDRRLRYTAVFSDGGASLDLVFTRTYGTYSGDEKCNIANLPFAYASTVEGSVRVGDITLNFDASPRYRGYAESTWGCTFPRPGVDGDDPIDFPVRCPLP